MPKNNSDDDKILRNLRELVAKSQSIHVDDVITIKGIVRSETTGKSISRIKVFANAPGEGQELGKCDTDGKGEFRLAIPMTCSYVLTFHDKSHEFKNLTVSGNPGDQDWHSADRVLPPEENVKEFQTLYEEPVDKLMTWYASDDPGMMSIYGPPRSGKSTLMQCFVDRIRRENPDAKP